MVKRILENDVRASWRNVRVYLAATAIAAFFAPYGMVYAASSAGQQSSITVPAAGTLPTLPPLFTLPDAAAPQLIQVQKMDFGHVGVADNRDAHRLTIMPDGDVQSDHKIVANAEELHCSEYMMTGFPSHMKFHTGRTTSNPPNDGGIVIESTGDLKSGSRLGFQLTNFTTNEPETDSGGNATLNVCATLKTSGSGRRIDSGTYNGTYSLTIYY